MGGGLLNTCTKERKAKDKIIAASEGCQEINESITDDPAKRGQKNWSQNRISSVKKKVCHTQQPWNKQGGKQLNNKYNEKQCTVDCANSESKTEHVPVISCSAIFNKRRNLYVTHIWPNQQGQCAQGGKLLWTGLPFQSLKCAGECSREEGSRRWHRAPEQPMHCWTDDWHCHPL